MSSRARVDWAAGKLHHACSICAWTQAARLPPRDGQGSICTCRAQPHLFSRWSIVASFIDVASRLGRAWPWLRHVGSAYRALGIEGLSSRARSYGSKSAPRFCRSICRQCGYEGSSYHARDILRAKPRGVWHQHALVHPTVPTVRLVLLTRRLGQPRKRRERP